MNSVSACAFHPKKPIFATASDDETWRLWTLPNCELVMSGKHLKENIRKFQFSTIFLSLYLSSSFFLISVSVSRPYRRRSHKLALRSSLSSPWVSTYHLHCPFLSVHLSASLSLSLSVSLSVSLSLYLSLSISISFYPLSVCLSVSPSLSLCVSPSIYLSLSGMHTYLHRPHSAFASQTCFFMNSFPISSHLVTSSGDGTVKIWEFAQAKCTHTFFDHTQAVWGCEIHYGTVLPFFFLFVRDMFF